MLCVLGFIAIPVGIFLLCYFDPKWARGMDDFHPASKDRVDSYDGSKAKPKDSETKEK